MADNPEEPPGKRSEAAPAGRQLELFAEEEEEEPENSPQLPQCFSFGK